LQGGCRQLSGTSVASPVVAGAVALLASTVPERRRWSVLNPASMKQALVEGAERLPDANLFEQGNGLASLAGAKAVLDAYSPRASLVPGRLDLTDCPYMWPFCSQPLYAFRAPLALNATVLNGLDAAGRFAGPPSFEAGDEGGRLLEVSFEWGDVLWPWSGYLAIFIEARLLGG
jgi:membrane-bound transcription factor site-1 protease